MTELVVTLIDVVKVVLLSLLALLTIGVISAVIHVGWHFGAPPEHGDTAYRVCIDAINDPHSGYTPSLFAQCVDDFRSVNK